MFRLEPRPEASRLWSYGSPLLALALTVLIGTALFIALGKDPVRGLQLFFWEPLKSRYALGELMVKATPLLLIALGLALCFRANVWNIGAEGQYVIGAVAAGGVALLANQRTGAWIWPAILLAGVLGGMAWAALVALLRDRFHANEILVSLMLVYVAALVLAGAGLALLGSIGLLRLRTFFERLHAPSIIATLGCWLIVLGTVLYFSVTERLALHALLNGADDPARHSRIALVGLRGAGKSTLGPLLARALDMPFVELSHAIESLAGCSVREIHNLYGTMAYRRHERRALEETLQIHSEVVIATPGGIVSDPATFQQLLAHCTTVWLRAAPEEHMGRVVAQGDMRPMADSQEAMDDLRRILDGRAAFYSKADITIDTSGQTPDQSLQALVSGVRKAMGMGMGMGSSRD
ncbi:hypothetical protein ET532_022100 [Verminephrobacter sp. Larva24]|nr:hypothetical protein ET532_022100 [Verminephrobacter sp. Larva24]